MGGVDDKVDMSCVVSGNNGCDGNTSQLVIGPGHEINQLGWCFVGSPLSPYTIHNNMLRAALTGVVARSTAVRATPAFRAAAPLGKLIQCVTNDNQHA